MIRKFFENDFLRNALTLISGTTIAQAINIISIPVLSRFYTPEDFGYLGLYMAIAAILISISTLQFHRAIILPKVLRDSKTLSLLSCCFVFGMAILSAVVILIGGEYILKLFEQTDLFSWIIFIPLTIICVGLKEILFVWFNKKKEYKTIARSRVIIAISTSVISILFGLLIKDFSIGLLLGLLSGQLFGTIYLLSFSIKEILNESISINELKRIGKRFSNFPKFTLPSELMNVFINQIPIFGLNAVIGQVAVGFFNMSNKVLGLPISLVGGAVSEVFKQKAAEEVNIKGNCRTIYIKTLKGMIGISVVPFIVLLLFGPQIFSFVLGEEWFTAGRYAQVLAPLFLFRFFASPLSFMYHLFSKQKEELIISIYFLLSSIIIFYFLKEQQVLKTLMLFSINYVVIYLFVLYRGYNFSKA